MLCGKRLDGPIMILQRACYEGNSLYVIFDLENMRILLFFIFFLLIKIVGLDAWLTKIVF